MLNSLFLLAIMFLDQGTPAARVIARPLTPKEVTATASLLDRSQIDGLRGSLQVQKSQVFAVKGSSSSFLFEPVLYQAMSPDTGNAVPRCGVFILRDQKKSSFVPTLGSPWTEAETCTDLDGVGFSETGAEMPRILLLYSASSPNYSTKEPIVLDWDAAAHEYRGNKDLSLALTHKGGNVSIAGMKRRIQELGK